MYFSCGATCVVNSPYHINDAAVNGGDVAWRAGDAPLEQLGVELGDAHADAVALRRPLHRPLEHLHRLHLPHLLHRRDLDRLRE